MTEVTKGVWYGLGAYTIWGCFPLFFALFEGVPGFDLLTETFFAPDLFGPLPTPQFSRLSYLESIETPQHRVPVEHLFELSLSHGTQAGVSRVRSEYTFAAVNRHAVKESLQVGGLLDLFVYGYSPASDTAPVEVVRSYIAAGRTDQAEAMLANAPAAIATAPEVEAARAQLDLLKQAENAGPVAELTAQVEAEPDNHQARFDLATALHANGQSEEAVTHLLELFRRDREWNDGAAKTQLFTIFDALKPNDPVVLNGRRKLSSMIFA